MPITTGGKVYPIRSGDPTGFQTPQDALVSLPGNAYAPVPMTGVDSNGFASLTVDTNPKVNYLWYILGIVLLLGALKWASEHEKSGMEPKLVGIGVWNFVSVGIMAMLFIVVAKTVLNKYHVKGLTDIVTAA